MNNKFLARVVAGAMAVTMLGTVAFASSVATGKDYIAADEYVAGNNTHTLLAFVTNEKNAAFSTATAATIVAIDQVADTDKASYIAVDADKFADYDYLMVYYGGDVNEAASTCIDLKNVTTTDVTAAGGDEISRVYEVDGTKYFGVYYTNYLYDINTLTGVKFVGAGFKKTAGGNEVCLTVPVDGLSGEGELDLTVGFVGVPNDQTFIVRPVASSYNEVAE